MPLKSIPFFGKYKLRYDWEAFEEMVEALETPAFSDFGKIVSRMGPKTMRVMIWAGLLHDNPGLRQEDVKKIINEYMETHSLEDLTEVLMSALNESSLLGGDKGEAMTETKSEP
jgi:hypothetical protein